MSPTRTPSASPAGEQARGLLAVAGLGVRLRLPVTLVLSVIMVGLALLTGALWPSLRETFGDLPSGLVEVLRESLAGADLTTPAGWVTAEMLSIVAPALVVASGVLSVTKQLAGSEESHRLALEAATPVRRTTYLLGVALAASLNVLAVTVAAVVGLAVADPLGDLGLGAGEVLATGAHLLALGLFFTAVALLVAALSGRSRITSTLTAGVAGLAFVMTVFLPLADGVADAARTSPWYYYSSAQPITDGLDVVRLVVLLVAALVPGALSVVAIRRRDLVG